MLSVGAFYKATSGRLIQQSLMGDGSPPCNVKKLDAIPTVPGGVQGQLLDSGPKTCREWQQI
jgi:hypothetical protein